VAFISQSGAICAAIVDWSIRQGFGFSRLISLGNQADVNETDVLPHVAADEHTRVITLYLESVNAEANPELFRIAFKLATGAGKTMVMAMLIAWQAINTVRYPSYLATSSEFSSGHALGSGFQWLSPSKPHAFNITPIFSQPLAALQLVNCKC
jgi:hypothetical protein